MTDEAPPWGHPDADAVEKQADRLADTAVEEIADNIARAMTGGRFVGYSGPEQSQQINSAIEMGVAKAAGDKLPEGQKTTELRDAIRRMALHRSSDILYLAEQNLIRILLGAWAETFADPWSPEQ